MNKDDDNYINCIILLMGFAGCGKLTIAKEICKYQSFHLVDNHLINNPVLSIVEQNGIDPLPKIVWEHIANIREIIFNVVKNVSPSYFSFVFTAEMINDDDFSNNLYRKLLEISLERKSILIPVRIICAENELINRIRNEDRKNMFKSINPERVRVNFKDKDIYFTKHPNEITIDNSNKTSVEVAKKILQHLNNVSNKQEIL